MIRLVPLALAAFLLASFAQAADNAAAIRVGIIGLDTSHVVAFTKLLNNPNTSGNLAGVRVVAAFPGGSPDIPDSRDRLAMFTEQVQKLGVEIVDSIDTLVTKVDAVLLESVDGRPHLAQVTPVLKAGKPVFIDKPLAGTLADAVEIFRLAEQYNVPCFSSSSLRFYPGVQAMRDNPQVGRVLGCAAYGPCSLEPHHPDLFWYGVHGVETLYTIMGPGCVSVTRVQTEGTEVVTGLWKDGRVATFRGIRAPGRSGYGALVFGDKGIQPADMKGGGYQPLVEEICKFFRTGKPPVAAAETIELFAFMEAADESKRQGGAPVSLESVLAKTKGTIKR
jgi:predicted dehydrogenase